MEAWRIAAEVAVRLGHDFDLESVEEVQDEIARVAPAFAGVDALLLRRARDGVVVPLADHVDELTLGAAPPGAGVSWEPIPPQPAEADNGAVATPVATPAPAVALHRWSGVAPAPAAAPADAYSLRLVAAATLYGADRVVVASPSLARLAEDAARLFVNPRDLESLGVADGDRVRVTSSRATVELPIAADRATPRGTAFVASNLAGAGAADLIDIDAPATDLRVETLTERER
jgi:predicted molibdopterin-dependent oxidoreductase YjgC